VTSSSQTIVRVSEATPIPRVVRISNLHNVRQAAWLAAVGAPMAAACAIYLLLHRTPLDRHQMSWGVSIVGFAFGSVFGIMTPVLVALMAGTFTADERGIEFMPYTPRLRRWRFLEWAEVKRVRWNGAVATLVADDASLRILWNDLRPADREALKAHVESHLREHFGLTISTPPRPAWRRFALMSVLPVSSLLLCFAFVIRYPSYIPALLILAGAWFVFGYTAAVLQIVKHRRDPHNPSHWRLRRLPT
jgi:hypothetical protein